VSAASTAPQGPGRHGRPRTARLVNTALRLNGPRQQWRSSTASRSRPPSPSREVHRLRSIAQPVPIQAATTPRAAGPALPVTIAQTEQETTLPTRVLLATAALLARPRARPSRALLAPMLPSKASKSASNVILASLAPAPPSAHPADHVTKDSSAPREAPKRNRALASARAAPIARLALRRRGRALPERPAPPSSSALLTRLAQPDITAPRAPAPRRHSATPPTEAFALLGTSALRVVHGPSRVPLAHTIPM
jgi:hypothetical protein